MSKLFGFASAEEKKVFLLLLTVKGVGPRLAMAVISEAGYQAVTAALLKRDVKFLNGLSGVGKKIAERMAVELSDKARELGLGGDIVPVPGKEVSAAGASAVQALINLGLSLIHI